jgi:hypothetical protein
MQLQALTIISTESSGCLEYGPTPSLSAPQIKIAWGSVPQLREQYGLAAKWEIILYLLCLDGLVPNRYFDLTYRSI